MTPPDPAGAPKTDAAARDPSRGLQTLMTARLALRQFGLLFLAATLLFLMLLPFNYYELMTFDSLWNNVPPLTWKFISVPPLLAAVFSYVLFAGLLFALGSSERSFNMFFGMMVFALLLVNYDHTIIEWFQLLGKAVLEPAEGSLVSGIKILLASLFFLVVIVMHYNVLADDFARRMLRRGIPTKEVAKIRPGMFKVLVPAVLTAGAAASLLALVAEFGELAFTNPSLGGAKLQLVFLALLVIPIAYLVRGILRDMSQQRAEGRNKGPNG